jgi:hypothetical protein
LIGIDEDTYKVGLLNLQYFTSDEPVNAIEWSYPNGEFNPTTALNTVILASTNELIDEWNIKIQDMNPKGSITYESPDSFDEVDDEKGILKSILNPNV